MVWVEAQIIFLGAFELKASSVRKRLDKVFNCNEIPLPLLNSAHQSRLMMVMMMRKGEEEEEGEELVQ